MATNLRSPDSIALIGNGAIGKSILQLLADGGGSAASAVVAVLGRRAASASSETFHSSTPPLLNSIDELIERKPSLVVECASQQAVRDFGPALLAKGIDFMIVSSGALADRPVLEELLRCAEVGRAAISIPTGAVAGLDGLAALKLGGLDSVIYTSTKPPRAWKGTPVERAFDLDAIKSPTVVFEAPAREAALTFPQNANLAATVGLAGLGLDETTVRLIADPAATCNSATIEAEGKLGRLLARLESRPTENPKTSSTVAYSVVRAIQRRTAFLSIQ
jgi:aspartate dehydrogenase